MTVGTFSGFTGYSSQAGAGALTDTLVDSSYTIQSLAYSSVDNDIGMDFDANVAAPDTTVAGDWTFHYGTSTLDFSDGTYTTTIGFWSLPVATAPWSNGDTVTVALSKPATPEPDPDPNAAPTVTIAAASTMLAPGGTVALTATAEDSDGTIAGYQWTAPRGTFSTTTAAETVWTAPDRFSGTVDVRVTVRDNGGRRASATVTITVDPESVPALPAAGLALLAFLLAVRGTRHVRTRAVPPAGSRHSANADRPRRAG